MSDGRLLKLEDPSGRNITYAYDSTGRLTTVTDPNSNVYTLAYAGGRLASVTDPEGNKFSFSYYDNGYLNSFTDPLGRVTTFTFNIGGRLQSYIDARTNDQDSYQTTYTQTQDAPIPTGPNNLPIQITQESPIITTVTDPGNRRYISV